MDVKGLLMLCSVICVTGPFNKFASAKRSAKNLLFHYEHLLPSWQDHWGEKLPPNINSLAGLSRVWAGVEQLLCVVLCCVVLCCVVLCCVVLCCVCVFFSLFSANCMWGRGYHINKIPRKSRTIPRNLVYLICSVLSSP